jgi:hypothetical protein
LGLSITTADDLSKRSSDQIFTNPNIANIIKYPLSISSNILVINDATINNKIVGINDQVANVKASL